MKLNSITEDDGFLCRPEPTKRISQIIPLPIFRSIGSHKKSVKKTASTEAALMAVSHLTEIIAVDEPKRL